VSTRPETHDSRFRFWLVSAAAVAGIGIGAFLVFLLVIQAVYAWGFLGGFLFISLIFVAYGWMYDRRHRPVDGDY
jgi:hypothetical protein